MSVRTGVLDEKCAALQALGVYAEHLPLPFAPHLVQALQLAAAGANYFHEDIRVQVRRSMHPICVGNTARGARAPLGLQRCM